MSKVTFLLNFRDLTPKNMPTKTSQKKPSSSLRNASISSTTTEVETSLVKNWSTPSEPSELNTKLNKLSVSSTPHPTLMRWTSAFSWKSSDSAEMETVKLHWANSTNTSTSRSKEPSDQKNLKRSLPQSERTSQLLKLIKWLITLTRTETESSTTTNSSTSSPRNTPRYDLYTHPYFKDLLTLILLTFGQKEPHLTSFQSIKLIFFCIAHLIWFEFFIVFD